MVSHPTRRDETVCRVKRRQPDGGGRSKSSGVFAFVLLLTEVLAVKPIILICLCLIIVGCASNGVDYRNFAVDTYFPTPNEIQLAEVRAREEGVEQRRLPRTDRSADPDNRSTTDHHD